MSRLAPYLVILFVVSCAVSPADKIPRPDVMESREGMLTRIRTLALAGDYRELRKAGTSYLDRYPEDPALDEVRLLVASADIELGFFDGAVEVLSPFVTREGTDRARGRAHVLLARIHKTRGHFGDAALSLLESLTTDLDDSQRQEARKLLQEVVGLLPRDRLDVLRESHSSSPGIEFVLEASLSYARAYQDTAAERIIITELRHLPRDEPVTDRLFEEGVAVAAPVDEKEHGEIRYSIGVLCPLEGRYAPLGSEFLKGASVALKEARGRGMRGVEIVVGDTRGDPFIARSSAERLIVEEKVSALVGCVLSSATIAAAQVAEYNRTVLLSSVATEERIAEIGEWIFQTGIDVEVELCALARIATEELGLRRIALLSVDNLRSRRIGELFGREVALRGGEVCIYSYYPEGSTDFHETIQTLRHAAPEALFIASDVEDLILVLPQLSFYEFGVQLLGLNTWSSSRLLRMAGRDMEGALFPGYAGEQRDEEQFMAAVVMVDETIDDANPFVIGGYKGVKTVLSALHETEGNNMSLRDVLARALLNRRHPYVELVSGPGIPFYTVRDERLEPYTTVRINP